MDYFVNCTEMQGSIAISSRGKINKKEKFSLNMGPLIKCQKFREQIKNSHFQGYKRCRFKNYSSLSSS